MTEPCPDHGPDVVCDRELLTTDGEGFPHRSHLKGREPARHCMECGALVLKKDAKWRQFKGVNVVLQCAACHLHTPIERRGAKPGGV